MNRRVSVWKYVRVGKKWRYCKPSIGKNGKIKPDWVIVKGREEHHPEGNFYLHRYEGDREIWKKIGPNAQEAVNAADLESHEPFPSLCLFSRSALVPRSPVRPSRGVVTRGIMMTRPFRAGRVWDASTATWRS